MEHTHPRRRTVLAGLALALGLVFGLSLVSGLALAREPRAGARAVLPGADRPPGLKIEALWLILDPTRPVEESLPLLVEALGGLQAGGGIIDFDPTPQSSGPDAVPGLRVTVLAQARPRLSHLPGVLDVRRTLPPPPPGTDDVGILLLSTATITGRVTQADGVTPLDGANVDVFDAVSYTPIGSETSDPNGYYTATVTAPFDQAKVRFDDGLSPYHVYATEWYNGKYYFSTADAVDLSGGGTVGNISASLDRAGLISGTILYDSSFAPASGVMVEVYGSDGSYGGWRVTYPSGQYSVSLRAGTYKLRFGYNAVPEWHQDQGSLAAADAVIVTAGQTTTISALVAAAGYITGVVTDESTGLPIPVWPATLIAVYDEADGQGDRSGVVADPSGVYQIGALGTGKYRVLFYDITDFYSREYYDDKPGLSQADPVAVTAGITTPNIDAALTPVAPLGTVTGTLYELAWPMIQSPLDSGDNVQIHFYDAGAGALVDLYTFPGDGTTTVYTTYLPAGTYKVLFVQGTAAPDYPDYAPKWYDSQTSYANADLVTVTAGMTTPDVSAVLRLPYLGSRGCISGVVTAAADGSRLPGVEVRTYAAYAETYHQAYTDLNGAYEICGLLGDYYTQFLEAPYIPEWYNGLLARTDAVTVNVTAGATVANVNASLDLGGCVSGRVSDMSGLLANYQTGSVRLYDSAGSRVWFYSRGGLGMITSLDDDGFFVLCGLPSGDYVVECRTNFATVKDWAPVTVVAGAETSGVTCVVARHVYLPLVLRNG